MAQTTQGAALTEQHRQAQLALRSRTLRSFLLLWPLWNGDEKSFARLIQAAVPLTLSHHRLSATLAGSYFDAYRAAAGVRGAAAPRLASLETARIVKSLYVTGQVMTRNALQAGQTAEQARATALTRVSGAVARLVLAGGRDTIVDSVHADRQALGWARVTDGAPCYFCLTLASRGAVYKSEDTAGFEAHDHCVPAGTVVAGPSVELAFRRWYEGEVVIIGLAGGDELTITPNHPVLTDRGWVEAGLLREGDHVLRRFGADLDALRVPHEDEVPTAIEDVWGAAGMNPLRSVPVAAEDFHGDGVGSKGDVDVVAAHSLLADVVDSVPLEFSDEELDAGARLAAVPDAFAGCCDTHLVGLAVARAEASSSGRRGDPMSLGGIEARHHLERGLARAATLNSCLEQPSAHSRSGHAVALSEGLFGLACEIAAGDVGRRGQTIPRWPAAAGTRFNPAPTKSGAERLLVHAELGRDLAERLAGGVERGCVLHLRRVEFAGHVYNLQTSEGWYDANRVIVSNCGCAAVPVFRPTDVPAAAKRWLEIYDRAQRQAVEDGTLQPGENTSAARLNAVRRLLAAEGHPTT